MAEKIGVSNAFQTFFKEAPDQQKIWMETVKKLDGASKLDKKTEEIAYNPSAKVRVDSSIVLIHQKVSVVVGIEGSILSRNISLVEPRTKPIII